MQYKIQKRIQKHNKLYVPACYKYDKIQYTYIIVINTQYNFT